MARRDPEMDPRAFLGTELTRARKAAGFSSQDALAAKLGFDRTVIAKAETGDRPPTDEVLDLWCDVCNLDRELFGRWAAFARRTDGPIPSWFESWLEAEQTAAILKYWSPIIITPIFQTADYARALLLAAQTDTSDEGPAQAGVRLARIREVAVHDGQFGGTVGVQRALPPGRRELPGLGAQQRRVIRAPGQPLG